MRIGTITAIAGCFALTASPAAAQKNATQTRATSPVHAFTSPPVGMLPSIGSAPPDSAPARSNGRGAAFAVEAMGGTLGSGAGLGLGLILAKAGECHVDDIACFIESAALAMAISTAGSALGTTVVGRLAGTKPSGAGAIVGAVAGAAAGLGMAHLLSEEADLVRSEFLLAVSYSISQGIVTAIGSRVGAWIRG